MPLCRKRTTSRGTIGTPVYKKAADEHLSNGMSIRAAAKKFSLSHVTLLRYIKKLSSGNTTAEVGYRSAKRVLSDEEETILEKYIVTTSDLFYGLSPKEVRILAYQMAVKRQKKFPPMWHDNQMAGSEWFAGFLKRHSSLTLRKSQMASLAPATATSSKENNINESSGNLVDNLKVKPKDDADGNTDRKSSFIIADESGIKQEVTGQLKFEPKDEMDDTSDQKLDTITVDESDLNQEEISLLKFEPKDETDDTSDLMMDIITIDESSIKQEFY